MSKRKLFGTDGIRGCANSYPMTPEVMMELGRALAMVFRLAPKPDSRPRVLIGKDTRRSGYMLEDALASGLCSMGVDVLQVGPLPTPGLAFLTVDMRCDAGAMISASHNSFEDNGVKFFSGDGFKLPDDIERRIEELMYSDELVRARPKGAEIGRAKRIDDALGSYIVFLKKTLPASFRLDGLRIAIDCANGAAYKVAPTVLEELGAEVIRLGTEPNGTNINDGVGALHPDNVARAVRQYRSDLGIALDGDADRVMLVDERGNLIDGDQLLAMCAREMKRRGALSGDAVVGTVMSNLGLERALQRMDLRLVRTDVGDRYVVDAMVREKINLGGEQSGHVIFLDHGTTGDGMLSALQVLALMNSERLTLSQLAGDAMQRVPQVLRGEGWGRLLVRYSRTEPLARVMLEGEAQARIHELADEVCAEISRLIGEG
jgi:phosphoglucosamine mutase